MVRPSVIQWCLVCLAVGLAAACGGETPTSPEAPTYASAKGQALGTSWSVTWRVLETVEDAAVRQAVEASLADVDAAMSTWRDDSELQVVRRGEGPVAVGPATAGVVRASLALAEATDGAFDPTVEPLIALWGFRGEPRETWPTEAELAEARSQTGFGRVVVGRDADGRPTVDAGGTALDLSGIAKGHAVDRVSTALSGLGLTDHLVEVGGEVRAHGRSPRDSAWVLGIEPPEAGRVPGTRFVATTRVVNGALATSGNYRNRYVLDDGRTVHHTLDPRTGLPATTEVLSATVWAPDCQSADGWATALMVMGSEAGLAAVEARPGLEAWLVVSDKAAADPSEEVSAEDWQVRASSGAAARLVTSSL